MGNAYLSLGGSLFFFFIKFVIRFRPGSQTLVKGETMAAREEVG